jgi:hypothetical protein
MSLAEDDRVEVTILGHTFRAPVDEAREFAEKVAQLDHRASRVPELEREIAELKLALGREATRRSRALQSLTALQAAAGKAAQALEGGEQ